MVKFVRVEDPNTRHRFDVREDSYLLKKGLVRPIDSKAYPPTRMRRKHRVLQRSPLDLAGQSVTQNQDPTNVESTQAFPTE